MEFRSSGKRRGGQGEEPQSPPSSNKKPTTSISSLGFVHLRRIGGGPDERGNLIFLRSDRLYTVGRDRRHCQIVLDDNRCISRRHCQFFLDGLDRKLRLVDGVLLPPSYELGEIGRKFRSCDGLASRVSLNGVFVNGRIILRGSVAELSVGDWISFGCKAEKDCECRTRHVFIIEKIFFSKTTHSRRPIAISSGPVLCSKRHEELVSRAKFLLRHCRCILRTADPVSYLTSFLDLDDMTTNLTYGIVSELGSAMEISVLDPLRFSNPGAKKNGDASQAIGSICLDLGVGGGSGGNDRHGDCITDFGDTITKKSVGASFYSDGKRFYLNRLEFMRCDVPLEQNGVCLPELLHPVDSLIRVFMATFTSDVPWFLSYCQVPYHLPITIACHNAERCWSSSSGSRMSIPYEKYPNVVLVYPPFPDVIAFGKDRKKRGVACHHPKLIVLQRKDSLRVIVSSANLVSKQWNNVTNTVWWQDFPRRIFPDYVSLFETVKEVSNDFVAQLAGFMASLITDVPSQAHWIGELVKYDFKEASAYLVASVPGMHTRMASSYGTDHCLSSRQSSHSQLDSLKSLGSIEASVVGLSHRFHASFDSDGVQIKTLASILGKYRAKTSGMLEVVLKRNTNIPADVNAVSVLVQDFDEHLQGDCTQLGFLARDVAKWVSPLSDNGFFSFSAFIYPEEALEAALRGNDVKVQLILYVSKGPKFSEMAKLFQPEHLAPLCSLLASIQRCLGLWRLQEVLSQYKWPETLETDFIYGSSSIGTSVSPQFLAAFSAATGKRSFRFSDSEESDPEWGCWNDDYEKKNASMQIVFPTINRVKNGACGIQHSRFLLCLSEKTWERLKTAGIFCDAIPHPDNRIGYPMHVKVACRRFQVKTGIPSFGWVYCGSHNFSPAAWGHAIHLSSGSKLSGSSVKFVSAPRLHICNYELGVLLIQPPVDNGNDGGKKIDLDDIILPFVVPAPKYEVGDRPATARAMREALVEAAVLERQVSLASDPIDEMDEEVLDDEVEIIPSSDYYAEEKEDEKIYAEMLWSQVDSSES